MSTILDCDKCVMAGPGCADCVVSLLLQPAYLVASSVEAPVFFTKLEQTAIEVLEGAGLLAARIAAPQNPLRKGTRSAGLQKAA